MSESVVKKTNAEIINTRLSLTSGYARVNDERIKPGSSVFVQQKYGGAGQYVGYWFTTQIQEGGYMYIYVRETSRAVPADGTKIDVSILIV